MRDLFLLGLLPVFLYAMAQRPFIAVGMWVWTALFFPNAWVYGMAGGIRYNLLFAAVAIIGYLAMNKKPRVHFGTLGTLVMVFPSVWWRWSPELEFVGLFQDPVRNLSHVLVPAILLGLSLSAVTMRMTRTMMLEVLRQDYVRTARAKGLGEGAVIFRHALRNSLIPVVTLIGLQAPLLFGGAVILEQIFLLPGMGTLFLDAVFARDYPIVTGVFLVVGVSVLVINLLVDLAYGYLDPRVRYG